VITRLSIQQVRLAKTGKSLFDQIRKWLRFCQVLETVPRYHFSSRRFVFRAVTCGACGRRIQGTRTEIAVFPTPAFAGWREGG